jgi:hypothetical protein
VTSRLAGGAGWGTREQAIPGEWAALVLVMVLGALLGLLVLWFTVLRHERTVRRRAARRPDALVALAGIGPAAAEKATPEPGPETADEVDEEKEESEASEEAEENTPARSARPPAPSEAAANGKRKLTDEILSRIESELAGRERPQWRELAALVQQEFGVTVHPSSIQMAVKRRRLAAEGVAGVTSVPDMMGRAEPASAPA